MFIVLKRLIGRFSRESYSYLIIKFLCQVSALDPRSVNFYVHSYVAFIR